MNKTASENDLLQASLAGDKEAFGAIVRRYQSLVCAIAYSATGDLGKSEELAQESFLRAWKSLRQLDDLTRFRAWLCTIARNLVSQSVRAQPRDVLHKASSLEAAESLATESSDPGQTAISKERQELVWDAVGRVPEKYREPLVLFYRRQQSISEVAADLDLSEDVVRQRLHRGRQLIKAEVSSLVEETLTRSGPSKAFAVAIVAALPALITPPAGAAVVSVAAKGTPAAKTLLATGLTGAILGPILGLLGGIFGCWCSIKNTKSPRERQFMIKMTILMWVLITILIGIPLVLMLSGTISRPVYWVCVGIFFALLLPFILWSNAHQKRIQIADGTFQSVKQTPQKMTRSSVFGSFSGMVFGSSAWLLIMTGLVHDWTALVSIIACDLLVFWIATRICLRRPDRYWPATLASLSVLGVMTLTLINLRWTVWMDAYRQTSSYNPTNDVSLRTLDLIVVGAYLALAVPMVWRFVASRKIENRPDSAGQA